MISVRRLLSRQILKYSANLLSSNKLNKSSNEFFRRERSSLTVQPYVIIDEVRHLSKDEIFLLSKGFKFIPTPKHIDKAKIKEEIEVYGRKLRLT